MSNGWGRARAARPAELRNGMCAIGRGHHPSGVSPRCPRRGPLSGGTGTPPPACARGECGFHYDTLRGICQVGAAPLAGSIPVPCALRQGERHPEFTELPLPHGSARFSVGSHRLLLSMAGEIQGPGRSPRWRGAISVCRDRRVPGRGQLWEAVGTSAAAGCCIVLGRGCRGERQPLGAAVAVTDHRPAGLAFLPRFRGTECRIRMPRTSRPREGTEVLGRRGPPSFHAMAPGRRLTGCYGI